MKDLLRQTLRDFFEARHPDAGLFPDGAESIRLELPRDPGHGDLSSNVAMVTAGRLGMPPRELAAQLADWCNEKLAGRAEAELAGPGFINFRLAQGELQSVLATILDSGADYGRSDAGAGQRVNLEYVSANPTGPPVIVSARAAAFGSTLAALMDFAGYAPVREYFLNDAGQQIRNLGASLRARWIERQGGALEIPENGYHGLYLKDMAEALDPAEVEAWQALPEDEALEAFAARAVGVLRGRIEEEMERFRSPFDVWFSEKSLHEGGKLDEALAFLDGKGLIYRDEGALWFRTTDFGDDKDRVVIKSDGNPATIDGRLRREPCRRGERRLVHRRVNPGRRTKAVVLADLRVVSEMLRMSLVVLAGLVAVSAVPKMEIRAREQNISFVPPSDAADPIALVGRLSHSPSPVQKPGQTHHRSRCSPPTAPMRNEPMSVLSMIPPNAALPGPYARTGTIAAV